MGLLIAANGYLEDQQRYAADQVIENIGTELASELENVGRIARNSQQVSLQVSQPRNVVSNAYSAEIQSPGECSLGMAANACLVVEVTRNGENTVREFAVQNRSDVVLSIDRVDHSTFGVAATRTTGVTTDAAVVPVEQDLRVGVGADVRRINYGNTSSPTNRPPIAKFEVETAYPVSDEPVKFNASESRDPDGSIEHYYWFVNGSDTGVDNVTYQETLPAGDHNVTLKVVDDDDDTARVTRNVSVSGMEYNSDYTVVTGGGGGGKTVSFSYENTWPDEIVISHILVNPEFSKGGEVKIDSSSDPEIHIQWGSGDYEKYREISFKDKDKPDGKIIAIEDPNQVAIPSGETVSVTFNGMNGNPSPVIIGIRYWHNGESHRTMFEGSDS
uniref:PKD domain-containing protein n=1 Tax=Halorhabdus salina TaxID=2750670 RepID=UPI0015EF4BF9|nr:PKD domain-containing protein [Halorhabdus salina]